MKIRDSTMPKIETVTEDDGAVDYEHTYFPDIPVDKTTMPEQDVIDDEGKPIAGLDHIVDNISIWKSASLQGRKSFMVKSLVSVWIKMEG